jgi:hypothetical protein
LVFYSKVPTSLEGLEKETSGVDLRRSRTPSTVVDMPLSPLYARQNKNAVHLRAANFAASS